MRTLLSTAIYGVGGGLIAGFILNLTDQSIIAALGVSVALVGMYVAARWVK